MHIHTTYTFIPNTVIDANQIDQNFSDIINGLSLGTNEINIYSLTLLSDLNISGDTILGSSTSNELIINSLINTDILSSSFSLGSTSYSYKNITLDNGATDGGAIYFNSSSSCYIKSDASGAVLNIEGFATGSLIASDGYLRLGVGEDFEMSVTSGEIIFRNRTSDKDLKFYTSRGGTDTEIMRVEGSTHKLFSSAILDGANVNLIINGDFKIWQRATYVETVSAIEYLADRWYKESAGEVITITAYQSTVIPTVTLSSAYYSMKIVPTNTKTGATSHLFFSQKIEGYNVHTIMGCPVTISFWVRSNKTGIYSVALRNSGKDRSYVTEYTINAVDTWEFKTISVASIDNSAGTWNYTNGSGLELIFTLKGSTTYATSTLNTWQAADYMSSTNQVNFQDSTVNDFYITNVCLSKGTVFLPFNHRSFNEELKRCERYYEKSFNYGFDTLHTFVTAGAYGGAYVQVTWTNVNFLTCMGTTTYNTRKRDIPTTVVYSVNGTSARVNLNLTGVDCGPVVFYTQGESGYNFTVTSATVNNNVSWHHIANSEIY